MAEFASHAVGTAGLTTGIIGTALGALNGGLNMLGGNNNFGAHNGACPGHNFVTEAELAYAQELAKKDSEIALLKSEQNTEIKIADVYERIMTRVNADQRAQADWNASQAVANARMSAAVATNASSICDLERIVGGITKTVVPKDAICPEYMNRYNSWTAPTD